MGEVENGEHEKSGVEKNVQVEKARKLNTETETQSANVSYKLKRPKTDCTKRFQQTVASNPFMRALARSGAF